MFGMFLADLMAAEPPKLAETNRGVCALGCSCCQDRGADYSHAGMNVVS